MSNRDSPEPAPPVTPGSDRTGFLARVPDVPRWVETRGLLLSGRGEVIGRPGPAGFLVRAATGSFLCVVGRPALAALRGAIADPALRVILCAREIAAEIALETPEWKRTAAIIHALPDGSSGAREGPTAMVAVLSRADGPRLDHLPAKLREEIAGALDSSHVAAAFLEGVPVSFCYPAYETETLWDLSIDTLAGYRRRGLAYACAEFLIDHMRAHGKSPVWGALEDNVGSLRLAKALGFEAVDRMSVLLRPGFGDET